jgi:hypothetical protein
MTPLPPGEHRDALAAAVNGGGPTRAAAAEELAALLDLPSVGLSIRGARIVGRGSTASADLYLSDDTTLMFEKLRDVGTANKLTLEVAACTGAVPKVKSPEAMRAVVLLRLIADHELVFTADELAIDWGSTYLQSAEHLDVDLRDQAARWAAFTHLKGVDPEARAREQGISLVAANVVLRHVDETRLVRCGWFYAYARGQSIAASASDVAHRMERVGWARRGGNGRIKATSPGIPATLAWSFYTVPADWESSR